MPASIKPSTHIIGPFDPGAFFCKQTHFIEVRHLRSKQKSRLRFERGREEVNRHKKGRIIKVPVFSAVLARAKICITFSKYASQLSYHRQVRR